MGSANTKGLWKKTKALFLESAVKRWGGTCRRSGCGVNSVRLVFVLGTNTRFVGAGSQHTGLDIGPSDLDGRAFRDSVRNVLEPKAEAGGRDPLFPVLWSGLGTERCLSIGMARVEDRNVGRHRRVHSRTVMPEAGMPPRDFRHDSVCDTRTDK